MSIVVCIFTNPPLPRKTKTRLIPALGEQGAADLARAMLLDTVEMVQSLDWALPVLTVSAPMPEDLKLPGEPEQWLQGSGDLGERQERMLNRALAQAPAALLIGTDLPGLPGRLLEEARQALEQADAALGPAEDGGFYLLGLRRCPEGILSELPWSSPDTFNATRKQLKRLGLKVEVISSWFDVDCPEDLERVKAALESGEVEAPHLAQWFRER